MYLFLVTCDYSVKPVFTLSIVQGEKLSCGSKAIYILIVCQDFQDPSPAHFFLFQMIMNDGQGDSVQQRITDHIWKKFSVSDTHTHASYSNYQWTVLIVSLSMTLTWPAQTSPFKSVWPWRNIACHYWSFVEILLWHILLLLSARLRQLSDPTLSSNRSSHTLLFSTTHSAVVPSLYTNFSQMHACSANTGQIILYWLGLLLQTCWWTPAELGPQTKESDSIGSLLY